MLQCRITRANELSSFSGHCTTSVNMVCFKNLYAYNLYIIIKYIEIFKLISCILMRRRKISLAIKILTRIIVK